MKERISTSSARLAPVGNLNIFHKKSSGMSVILSFPCGMDVIYFVIP